MTGVTPGQAVYEAARAVLRHRFPGVAPIGWDELPADVQSEQESIAMAGIAAYIKEGESHCDSA